jgi:MoxR-like ATPase
MTALTALNQLKSALEQSIIGQKSLVERLLIALIADGHLLVEGAPGLAKTRAIKCLSDGIEADFHRIQFTPDLLPSDVTGTDIYRPQTSTFEFQPGPIFHNLVLADEINRAPAKVQSALLEAMAERQVSVGKSTYPLPELFMVMATQNPIEQEGTYPLPEAQLDRFLMHVRVDFPDFESEREILRLSRNEAVSTENKSTAHEIKQSHTAQLSQKAIFDARQAALELHLAEAVEDFMVSLTHATRHPENYDAELKGLIEFGVSPRATISLDRCARAHALLAGRDFVSPSDVHAVVHDVFRHRMLLSFEAEARGIGADNVIDRLLELVPIAA